MCMYLYTTCLADVRFLMCSMHMPRTKLWVQERMYQDFSQEIPVLLYNFGILRNMTGGTCHEGKVIGMQILSGEFRQRMCHEFVKTTLNKLI